MIVLDPTVVNVALPSIRESLAQRGFAAGGCERLQLNLRAASCCSRRLGDYFGHRRMFLQGDRFVSPSLPSLWSRQLAVACSSPRARCRAGRRGVSLSRSRSSSTVFTYEGDRSERDGRRRFLHRGGRQHRRASPAVSMTSGRHWHGVFLVNLPIGMRVYALCRFSFGAGVLQVRGRLDVAVRYGDRVPRPPRSNARQRRPAAPRAQPWCSSRVPSIESARRRAAPFRCASGACACMTC